MNEVVNVIPQENYYLEIYFVDNVPSLIDIKPFISGGISDKLNDINYFKSVKIDEFGGIYWDNGFDFCPNLLKNLNK